MEHNVSSMKSGLHTIEDHLYYFHTHLEKAEKSIFDLEKIPIQMKQLESMGKYVIESLRDLEERIANLEKSIT